MTLKYQGQGIREEVGGESFSNYGTATIIALCNMTLCMLTLHFADKF